MCAAWSLWTRGGGPEAKALLQGALQADPHNAFTLNNLGVAKETEGDLESALKYYTAAAATHASQQVIVTVNREWRGKPVSEMAAESVQRLSERIRTETAQERAAMLNLQGV